jgi:hypothetical protein
MYQRGGSARRRNCEYWADRRHPPRRAGSPHSQGIAVAPTDTTTTLAVVDPATGAEFDRIPAATDEDVDRLVRRAAEAQPGWMYLGVEQRRARLISCGRRRRVRLLGAPRIHPDEGHQRGTSSGRYPSMTAARPAVIITHPGRNADLLRMAVVVGTGDGPCDRNPAATLPIGLDLFSDWCRPHGPRYQHGFSTRSGNDRK